MRNDDFRGDYYRIENGDLREAFASEPRLRWGVIAIVLAALIAFFVSFQAEAQEPRRATITFDAPTKYTDGTPIEPGTEISYRLYQGEQGEDKAHVATFSTTATTVQTGLQPGKTYCWEVTAVINEQESARSNEGCKTFDHLVPETVTITVQ